MAEASQTKRRMKTKNGIIGEEQQKDHLGEAFEKNIRPFIEVIDNLRKHGLQSDIKLPNVVVVGDQSSGKSSIIEAISGVQLPRGRGIVTRCPLELQLKRMLNNVKWKATLRYLDREIDIHSPKDVEERVKKAQNEICGGETNISDELLTLRIESNLKNAPELTLIDLPGIVRTATLGQSKNIYMQIRNMIEKYVRNENTVILCMVSANLDVAVNESLNVAREFDPDNERTIGVITKPDLAEDHQKEGMLRLLNNEIFTLKKGYRMVKCRNQEELSRSMALNESLDSELDFFKNDSIYSAADQSLLGTSNLANKITEELVTVIKKSIPKLKEEIKRKLQEAKHQLDGLPVGVPNSDGEKRSYLMSIFFSMIQEIEKLLTKGNYSGDKTNEKNIYPSWRAKFEKFQSDLMLIQRNALSNEFILSKLKNRIKDTRGREICGFLNYELFETLVSDHVAQYHPIANELLNEMKTETEDALLDVVGNYLGHLPDVKKDIITLVTQSVESCGSNAQQNLELIFEEEKTVFAMDSVFQSEMNRIVDHNLTVQTAVFGRSNVVKPITLEDNSAMLQNILQCYLNIVLNRLCDIIPMTIRQWIHVRLNNTLKDFLMKYYGGVGIDDKVKENVESQAKRLRLYERWKRLEHARQQLNQF